MTLNARGIVGACAALFVLMLSGCTPVPATIHFPDGSVTVESLDTVPVPTVQVVDKNGQPIEPTPFVTWSRMTE